MLRASRATGASWWGCLSTDAESISNTPFPQPQLIRGSAVLAFAAGCLWPSRGRGTPSTWYLKGVELDVLLWMSVLQVVLA